MAAAALAAASAAAASVATTTASAIATTARLLLLGCACLALRGCHVADTAGGAVNRGRAIANADVVKQMVHVVVPEQKALHPLVNV